MEKELSNSMGFIGKMNRWIQFTKQTILVKLKGQVIGLPRQKKKWHRCDHIQGVLAGIKNMILL